jgi:hypothetical protein
LDLIEAFLVLSITKRDIQDLFRGYRWHFHVVIEPRDVMWMGDQEALTQLRLLNYRLCKWWLPKRFAELPLERRFHWAAFFQGSRDAGTRHLHVLLYVPPSVPMATTLERVKLNSSIQQIWLGVRDGNSVFWLWKRPIEDAGGSRAAATYVSRQLTRVSWGAEDVHFSQ